MVTMINQIDSKNDNIINDVNSINEEMEKQQPEKKVLEQTTADTLENEELIRMNEALSNELPMKIFRILLSLSSIFDYIALKISQISCAIVNNSWFLAPFLTVLLGPLMRLDTFTFFSSSDEELQRQFIDIWKLMKLPFDILNSVYRIALYLPKLVQKLQRYQERYNNAIVD
jgi:hypothetical protein